MCTENANKNIKNTQQYNSAKSAKIFGTFGIKLLLGVCSLCMTPSLFTQSEVKYGGYFFTFNDGQFVMPLRENPRRYLQRSDLYNKFEICKEQINYSTGTESSQHITMGQEGQVCQS